MKKEVLKSNKGVTLSILIITIVVILILTSTIIYQVNNTNDSSVLNYLYADIQLIRDKVLAYYNKYREVPIKGEIITNLPSDIEQGEYYEIDISKLDNITLRYGNGTIKDKNIYILNTKTLDVYYLKGVKFKEKLYYSK